MKKFKTVRVVEGFRDKTASTKSNGTGNPTKDKPTTDKDYYDLEARVSSIISKAARYYGSRHHSISRDDVEELARVLSGNCAPDEPYPFDIEGQVGVDEGSLSGKWDAVWEEYFGLSEDEIGTLSDYYDK